MPGAKGGETEVALQRAGRIEKGGAGDVTACMTLISVGPRSTFACVRGHEAAGCAAQNATLSERHEAQEADDEMI